MTYEEIKCEIENLPRTWYPALFIVMAQSAIKAKVFKPGGATNLVRAIEKTAWAICPFCGHGSYLIDGKVVHTCPDPSAKDRTWTREEIMPKS